MSKTQANKYTVKRGQQFGALRVVKVDASLRFYNERACWCQCVCGQEVKVSLRRLHLGQYRSCGCVREQRRARYTKRRRANGRRALMALNMLKRLGL